MFDSTLEMAIVLALLTISITLAFMYKREVRKNKKMMKNKKTIRFSRIVFF
ncbi:hypothetical protein [Lysinibacillus sphaericus]|uniref:hypothetical protein n=1 Tax=Lysinibacillus sphaericus TaxID=1421 RepID=UPI0018CED08E|nr:hypothetical protein [Lysinibacillus sphaericus]